MIYKYSDSSGIKKILENKTLRFAHPSELNDPFDIYIDDVFGMDVTEVLDESRLEIIDDLHNNTEIFAKKCGLSFEETQHFSMVLKNMSFSKKEEFMQLFFSKYDKDPDLQRYKQGMLEGREAILKLFKTYGVFCATKRHDNLLMWAHYGDKHRGAVLGFNPDIENDSALRLMEPVIYSKERPELVEKSKLGFKEESDFTLEDHSKALKRLLHTKSSEWEYEQELRLTIPDIINEGEKEWFLNLTYPHELVEVFLGYRMNEEEKNRIILLAKNFNPNVQIYSTILVRRQYRLEFDRLKL